MAKATSENRAILPARTNKLVVFIYSPSKFLSKSALFLRKTPALSAIVALSDHRLTPRRLRDADCDTHRPGQLRSAGMSRAKQPTEYNLLELFVEEMEQR